jgi:hypothetical protein
MKIMKTQITFLFVLLLLLTSCTTEENKDADGSNPAALDLHFAFKTPDWERKVDCTLLNLYPEFVNDTTSSVRATSASTKESFWLTYPKDSSQMVRPRTYKKYKIMEYGYNEEPFQFSQVLPLDESSLGNSSKTLVSKAGFSAVEYNQLTEIKYIKSETQYAVFKIKCTYEMKTYLPSTPDVVKPVTGTYAFIIRTSKL